MSDLKAGQLFKKDDKIYLIADSSNQRWYIEIVSGIAKWAFKANEGSIKDVESKGYKYFCTTQELLSGDVEKEKTFEVVIDEYYRPLNTFEKLLQEKLESKNV